MDHAAAARIRASRMQAFTSRLTSARLGRVNARGCAMYHTTVRDLLRRKEVGVATVSEDDSVLEAIQRLIEDNIGAVVVMHEDELIGIMSERDVTRNVAFAGRVAADTKVGDVMTRNVLYIRPDQTVEECMALMTDK